MSARPPPQPRPVRSVPSVPLGPGAGPAQPLLPGHREALQEGAQPRVEAGQVRSHATAAQSRPLVPPPARFQELGPSLHQLPLAHPFLGSRRPGAHVCTPYLAAEAIGVYSWAARSSSGNQWDRRWDGTRRLEPRPQTLVRGQALPHSYQASEAGALKPSVWEQALHPAPEIRHGAWNF